MSEGQGSISYNKRSSGAVPPFVNIAGARNGLSLDADNFVVLGNDEGEAGEPAQLLSDRQIELLNFFIEFVRPALGVMRLDAGGFQILQAFPNAVALGDPGLKVGTSTAADIGSSSFIQVFGNDDSQSIALMLIPTDFGIGLGSMLYAGQSDAADGNYALFFYIGGGVGLGAQDFSNNTGGVGGLSVDGPLLGQKFVDVETAARNLDNRFDSGKLFTNTGAGALLNLNLPDGRTLVKSGYFDFYVDDVVGIQINAPAGNVIQIGPSTSAAGGTATATTKGNALRLLLLNPGASQCQWVAQSVVGTWLVV